MHTIPQEGWTIILPFRSLFSKKVFAHVKVLVAGTLLAVGRRTVCAALRVMGLGAERRFHKYHRLLSRVKWGGLAASRLLLAVLVRGFFRDGEPLVFGLDETLERRTGKRIQARGSYRDPVRSSQGHVVKCYGLRWVCVLLLCPIPWAGRVWALPFLSLLAPSRRYCAERGRRYKKLIHWARQLLVLLRRWTGGRPLVVGGDSSYAALELLRTLVAPLTVITRLRLDAALYAPPPERRPAQRGPHRLKGGRQPSLQAVLTHPATRWGAWLSRSGTARRRCAWRWPPPPPSGTTPAAAQCPSAGCWCGTPGAKSHPPLC